MSCLLYDHEVVMVYNASLKCSVCLFQMTVRLQSVKILSCPSLVENFEKRLIIDP